MMPECFLYVSSPGNRNGNKNNLLSVFHRDSFFFHIFCRTSLYSDHSNRNGRNRPSSHISLYFALKSPTPDKNLDEGNIILVAILTSSLTFIGRQTNIPQH